MLQPLALDVYLNKLFKDKLKTKWMLIEIKAIIRSRNFKKYI